MVTLEKSVFFHLLNTWLIFNNVFFQQKVLVGPSNLASTYGFLSKSNTYRFHRCEMHTSVYI